MRASAGLSKQLNLHKPRRAPSAHHWAPVLLALLSLQPRIEAVGPGEPHLTRSKLLDAGSGATAAASADVIPSRKVKVYVYDLPNDLYTPGLGFAQGMENVLRRSEYFTANGDEADYFWIPGSGHYLSQDRLLKVFDHVRQRYPWWNRTRDAGQARHVIMLLSDDGPGSAAYQRPIHLNNGLPPDVNPRNPNRIVLFLQWNGMRDGHDNGWQECSTCFQIGKDIMIPTAENICGPLCGYKLDVLREKSIWSLSEEQLQAELTRKRKHRLFYAGSINRDPDDFTGRGGIYHHYVNRTGYLIARSGEHQRISFADAMRDSDFCYSPMGKSGGDTDRYIAAIMFGCIPVMLNSSHSTIAVPHALPLEEVLHWERFATIVNVWNLKRLDEQLHCLEPYVPMMRNAMRDVWQRMLWSNAYNRSYLGEDMSHDAMHTIMLVLNLRALHGFRSLRATMDRMSHRPRRFPCTNRPARLHIPGLQAVVSTRLASHEHDEHEDVGYGLNDAAQVPVA